MSKEKRKIVNWKQYNKALVNRGFEFSDTAIETALMIKGRFNSLLRTTEGFNNSLFKLMSVDLKSPDYTSISKRANAGICYKNRSRDAIAHLAIDEGTHEVIAAEVSLVNVGDNEVLPTLINPLRRKVKLLSADGAYDTKASHKLLKRKQIMPTIPPRKNAEYWEEGHPRNEAVKALKTDELAQWKQDSGYHLRSLSETAMYRYKQLISAKLSLRCDNAQVGEALAGVKAMNKVIGLGMPARQKVS